MLASKRPMDVESTRPTESGRRILSGGLAHHAPRGRLVGLRPASDRERASSWQTHARGRDLASDAASHPRPHGRVRAHGLDAGLISLQRPSYRDAGSRKSTDGSNAERWFDDSNRNVRSHQGSEAIDGELSCRKRSPIPVLTSCCR